MRRRAERWNGSNRDCSVSSLSAWTTCTLPQGEKCPFCNKTKPIVRWTHSEKSRKLFWQRCSPIPKHCYCLALSRNLRSGEKRSFFPFSPTMYSIRNKRPTFVWLAVLSALNLVDKGLPGQESSKGDSHPSPNHSREYSERNWEKTASRETETDLSLSSWMPACFSEEHRVASGEDCPSVFSRGSARHTCVTKSITVKKAINR